MIIRQKVALEAVRFFAFHGFYPEEQLTGNEFLVDVVTEMQVKGGGDDELGNTVNYERLFEIVSAEMSRPRKLLETVAHAVLTQIAGEFPLVDMVQVSIRKLRLPVKGEVRNSLVELTYRRQDEL